MARIAITGDNGGFGRTVTEALLKTQKHTLFIFTRTVCISAYVMGIKLNKHSDLFAWEPGESAKNEGEPSQLKTNYESTRELIQMLEDNQIDAVICKIFIQDNATNWTQLNLIRSAEMGSCAERFIPGEFAAVMTDE